MLRLEAGRRRAREPRQPLDGAGWPPAHQPRPARNPKMPSEPRPRDPAKTARTKMAKGLKKKSDLELTTAERAAVLRHRRARRQVLAEGGAQVGRASWRRRLVGGRRRPLKVCQEEMNRLEQQKPPKKQKRKKATLGAEGAEMTTTTRRFEHVPKKPKVKPVSKDGQAERTGKFSSGVRRSCRRPR